MTRAVLDVGSNSVLLLVSRHQEGAWTPILERSWVSGLGRGAKQTGLLSEEGMAETLDALREGYALARQAGASSILAGATMAARIARNTPEFLARAESQGTPVFVLSGDDEAALGFESVASDPLLGQADRISIIDPGGHSTELVTAQRMDGHWSKLYQKSFPIGTLALTGGVWQPEMPGMREMLAAVELLDDQIGMRYLPRQAGTAVVLGATGTNLVSIREGWSDWKPDLVHGAWLDFEEVSKAVGWLCGLSLAERAQVPGMEPGREGTIHAGALILERFLQAVGALGCRVSVRGWRHALLEQDRAFSPQIGQA